MLFGQQVVSWRFSVNVKTSWWSVINSWNSFIRRQKVRRKQTTPNTVRQQYHAIERKMLVRSATIRLITTQWSSRLWDKCYCSIFRHNFRFYYICCRSFERWPHDKESILWQIACDLILMHTQFLSYWINTMWILRQLSQTLAQVWPAKPFFDLYIYIFHIYFIGKFSPSSVRIASGKSSVIKFYGLRLKNLSLFISFAYMRCSKADVHDGCNCTLIIT